MSGDWDICGNTDMVRVTQDWREVCIKEPDHAGYHRSAKRTSWDLCRVTAPLPAGGPVPPSKLSRLAEWLGLGR